MTVGLALDIKWLNAQFLSEEDNRGGEEASEVPGCIIHVCDFATDRSLCCDFSVSACVCVASTYCISVNWIISFFCEGVKHKSLD